MSKRIINNNAAIIFGLCALLLLSLVAYDRFLGVTKSGINGVDTFEYWMYANDILAGKYKTVCNRLSAYVINVLAFLIIGQNDYSIKMAVALFGVINTCLVLVMTYAYGRSAIAALCAAAAYAFLPTIQYYSKIELVHTYSATFVLGVFVALVWAVEARDLRKRALAVASAGFAAGLAALSHEDLLLVTVGAGIVLAFMPSDVAAADHVFALPRPRDLVRDAFAGAFGFFLAFAFCMGTLGVSPGQMISGFFTMRQIMDGQTQGALGQASVAKDLPRILNDFGPAALGWPVTLAVAALAAAAPLLRRARKLPAQAIRPLTIAAILVVTYAVLYILASNSYLAGSYGRIFVPFIGPLVIVSFAALVRVHRGGGAVAALAMVGVPLFLHGLPQFGPRPVSLHRRVYDAAHDFVRPNARILLPACYSTPAKFVGPTSGAYFGDTAVALYLERTSVDFVSLIKDNAIRYVLVPSTPLEPWPMKAKHLTTLFEGIYGHPLDATEFPLQSGTALADLTPSLCNLESRLLREMVGALGGEVRAQVPGLGTVFELYRGDVPQFRLVNGGVQTAEGENINVTKGVQGWVEGAELHNGQIEVVGWAVADKNSAPIRLLAFSGERLVINMTASLPRLDVNNHLKADYQAPGFAFTVPADLAGKGKPEMRFFAVTPDFHYQELPCNPKSCVFLPPG